MAVLATLVRASDPARGKELVAKRCSGCHDPDKNKEGPHLRGVYGRTAGKAEGFNYSEGMKAATFAWDEQSLNRWLTDSETVVKDNDMAFRLADPLEREDVIAYLKSLSK